MRAIITFGAAVAAALAVSLPNAAAEVLFEDTFKNGLSMKWEAVGLEKTDYRVRDGGLEMRVQPGEFTKKTPLLRVALPFRGSDTLIASVRVMVLNDFTAEKEFAGMFLLENGGAEFGARQERVGGKLVYAPGNYVFKGKRGEEGDPNKFEVRYTDVMKDGGPLRIIVRGGYAHFQVGPSATGGFQNFFHSAIETKTPDRGFCLVAAGAPAKADHWVRFSDFKVER